MKNRFAGLCQLLALTLVACFCLSALALARADRIRPKCTTRLRGNSTETGASGTAGGQLCRRGMARSRYNGTNYPYVMVGQDPSTGQATVVTTYIIPVKIILSNGDVYDPLSGGTMSASRQDSPVPDLRLQHRPTLRAESTSARRSMWMPISAPISGASYRISRAITCCWADLRRTSPCCLS